MPSTPSSSSDELFEQVKLEPAQALKRPDSPPPAAAQASPAVTPSEGQKASSSSSAPPDPSPTTNTSTNGVMGGPTAPAADAPAAAGPQHQHVDPAEHMNTSMASSSSGSGSGDQMATFLPVISLDDNAAVGTGASGAAPLGATDDAGDSHPGARSDGGFSHSGSTNGPQGHGQGLVPRAETMSDLVGAKDRERERERFRGIKSKAVVARRVAVLPTCPSTASSTSPPLVSPTTRSVETAPPALRDTHGASMDPLPLPPSHTAGSNSTSHTFNSHSGLVGAGVEGGGESGSPDAPQPLTASAINDRRNSPSVVRDSGGGTRAEEALRQVEALLAQLPVGKYPAVIVFLESLLTRHAEDAALAAEESPAGGVEGSPLRAPAESAPPALDLAPAVSASLAAFPALGTGGSASGDSGDDEGFSALRNTSFAPPRVLLPDPLSGKTAEEKAHLAAVMDAFVHDTLSESVLRNIPSSHITNSSFTNASFGAPPRCSPVDSSSPALPSAGSNNNNNNSNNNNNNNSRSGSSHAAAGSSTGHTPRTLRQQMESGVDVHAAVAAAAAAASPSPPSPPPPQPQPSSSSHSSDSGREKEREREKDKERRKGSDARAPRVSVVAPTTPILSPQSRANPLSHEEEDEEASGRSNANPIVAAAHTAGVSSLKMAVAMAVLAQPEDGGGSPGGEKEAVSEAAVSATAATVFGPTSADLPAVRTELRTMVDDQSFSLANLSNGSSTNAARNSGEGVVHEASGSGNGNDSHNSTGSTVNVTNSSLAGPASTADEVVIALTSFMDNSNAHELNAVRDAVFSYEPFAALDETQLETLVCTMSRRVYDYKDTLVKEGEPCLDQLLLVLSGSVTVTRKGNTTRTLRKGSFFGEVEFSYDISRSRVTLTVNAANTVIYFISREVYKKLVLDDKDARRLLFIQYINRTALFRGLAPPDKIQLADSLRVCRLKKATQLAEQGSNMDWLYIIMSGEVHVSVNIAEISNESFAGLNASSLEGSGSLVNSAGSTTAPCSVGSANISVATHSPTDGRPNTNANSSSTAAAAGPPKKTGRMEFDKKTGDMVGDIEFIFSCKSLFNAVTKTDVQAARISRLHFEVMMSRYTINEMKNCVISDPSYSFFEKVVPEDIMDEVRQTLLHQRMRERKHARKMRSTKKSHSSHRRASVAIDPEAVDSRQSHRTRKTQSSRRRRGGTSGAGSRVSSRWRSINPNGEIVFSGSKNLYRFSADALAVNNTIVIAIIADGTIIRWSKAAQEATGYSPFDVIGQNVMTLLTTEDGRIKMRDALQAGLEYGGKWNAYLDDKKANPEVYSFHQSLGLYEVGLSLTVIPSSFVKSSEVMLLVGKAAKFRTASSFAGEVLQWVSESLKPQLLSFSRQIHALEAKNWDLEASDTTRLVGHMDATNSLVDQFLRFASLNTGNDNDAWRPVLVPALARRFFKEASIAARRLGGAFRCNLEAVRPNKEVFLDAVKVLQILRLLLQEALTPERDESGAGSVRPVHITFSVSVSTPREELINGGGTASSAGGEPFTNRAGPLGDDLEHSNSVHVTDSSDGRHFSALVQDNPSPTSSFPGPMNPSLSLKTDDTRKTVSITTSSLSRIRFEMVDDGAPLPLHMELPGGNSSSGLSPVGADSGREISTSSEASASASMRPRGSAMAHIKQLVADIGGFLAIAPNEGPMSRGYTSTVEVPLLLVPSSGEGGDAAKDDSADDPGFTGGTSFSVIVAESDAQQQQRLCRLLWARQHAVVPVASYRELMRKVEGKSADIIVIDPTHLEILSEDYENLESEDPYEDLRVMTAEMVLVVITADFTDPRVQTLLDRNAVVELPRVGNDSLMHIAMQEAEKMVSEMREERERIDLIRRTFVGGNKDRHRIGKVIGKGTFGAVYEVEDTLTGGKLAMKRMRLRDNVMADDVVDEILAMTSLQHENIIHYFYCEKVSDTELCLYMELAGGGTLQNKIRQNANHGLPLEDIVRHLTDICRGLAYIHSQHYVHGDLKTANLLLDTRGRIKIGDFGTTKKLQPNQQLYEVTGTPQYMAPEMFSTDHSRLIGFDWKADIWSLGCIVLEMATGMPPFSYLECTRGVGIMKYLSELTDTPDLSPLFSGNPLVYEFVKSCLDIDPNARPSAQELFHFQLLQGTVTTQRAERLVKRAEVLHKLNKYAAMQNDNTDTYGTRTRSHRGSDDDDDDDHDDDANHDPEYSGDSVSTNEEAENFLDFEAGDESDFFGSTTSSSSDYSASSPSSGSSRGTHPCNPPRHKN